MNDDFNLSLFGNDLVPATTANDLGVIMDPNLTFDNHVLETVSSCMSRLAQINRVKHSFDKQSLIIIINPPVFSKLFYCPCVWNNTSQRNLKMLQTVQNFACCIVSGRRNYDHVSPALRNCAGRWLRWLPVKERLYYRDAIMSFKFLTGCAPGYLSTQFSLDEVMSQIVEREVLKCFTYLALEQQVAKELFL